MILEKFTSLHKSVKVFIQVAVDMVCIFASYIGSLLMQYGINIPNPTMTLFSRTIIPIVLIYVAFFFAFALYRSFWQRASLDELIMSVAATACATIAIYFVMYAVKQVMPQSIYIAGGLIIIILTSFSRLNYRIIRRLLHGISLAKGERVMIFGAGEVGEMVIRQLLESKDSDMRPVIIVDDDKSKLNGHIQGIKIVGSRYDIPMLAKKYEIDVIIYCVPSASSVKKREILKLCAESNCKIKTVPSLKEFINDGQITHLRQINMSDLLPRPETQIDAPGIKDYITDGCVLVTGGGGSIGSELCRQIALFAPRRLVIFDIYENNAYELLIEMQQRFPEIEIIVEIGSVRDERRMEDIFSIHRPDVVFHAAAHKHVPLMEGSPAEAVKNNVFGTLNTARAADKFGVKRFVLISTDKAVYPSSVMGATKRIAENVIHYMNSFSQTKFVAVRFGNVLGSNGSVIPLFQRQIEQGGPVTVTHKDITRYFMTIPEAARLLLQAGSLAHKGDTFILDMGEPVHIDEIARMMIRLAGFRPDIDIKIEYTGLRPGEKLYEELFMDEEQTDNTAAKGIFVGLAQHPSPEETKHNLDWLWEQVEKNADIQECLQVILKTYHPAQIEVKSRKEQQIKAQKIQGQHLEVLSQIEQEIEAESSQAGASYDHETNQVLASGQGMY